MRSLSWLVLILSLGLFAVGCGGESTPPDDTEGAAEGELVDPATNPEAGEAAEKEGNPDADPAAPE